MLHDRTLPAVAPALKMLMNASEEGEISCPAAQVVANPHQLLCTLVLTNAVATEALPIFLDRLLKTVATSP